MGMTHLIMHVDEFIDVLEKLNSPRMVLSGSCVLEAHGINTGRKPSDLDIVIYDVTPEERSLIVTLGEKDMDAQESDDDEWYDEEETSMIVKLTSKEGLKMDILALNTSVPNREYIRYRGFQIHSVSEIIKVKSGYGRRKGLKDFLVMKNLNFNREDV